MYNYIVAYYYIVHNNILSKIDKNNFNASRFGGTAAQRQHEKYSLEYRQKVVSYSIQCEKQLTRVPQCLIAQRFK
jgi:hypothetical protein